MTKTKLPETPAKINKELSVLEFQAWLEGFNEAIAGSPNKAQWNKIQEKIALIRPDKTIQHVYNDWYYGRPYITYCNNTLTGTAINTLAVHNTALDTDRLKSFTAYASCKSEIEPTTSLSLTSLATNDTVQTQGTGGEQLLLEQALYSAKAAGKEEAKMLEGTVV